MPYVFLQALELFYNLLLHARKETQFGMLLLRKILHLSCVNFGGGYRGITKGIYVIGYD